MATTLYSKCHIYGFFLFSFLSFFSIYAVYAILHSENTILGVASLDVVSATHGGLEAKTEVVSRVLGRNDAVVL